MKNKKKKKNLIKGDKKKEKCREEYKKERELTIKRELKRKKRIT